MQAAQSTENFRAALADDALASDRIRAIRVALFSGNYNYTRDGANQALNRLVGHLLEVGAKVRVYSPTSARPAFPATGDLVSVRSVPLPGRGEYRAALPLSKSIRRDIEAFSPTVVHLSAPDLLGFQAQRMGRRLGIRVVSSLHTRFETYLSYYGLGWLRPATERYLRRFYAGCDTVLAPNGPLAELLHAQCPDTRVRIWSRGVDRRQFSPARRSGAWRESVGLAPDDVALLFLGRLVVEKGLDLFVQTVEALRGHSRIRPVIVGDGPAGDWLRKRLPDGIFTGLLVPPELGEAVASADILFNPSRTEAFGNATLEGMAAGLAVVCPDAPSTRELIASGVDGMLVENHGASDYATAIALLASDADLRSRLSIAARCKSERYDWRESSCAVMNAYAEVLDCA